MRKKPIVSNTVFRAIDLLGECTIQDILTKLGGKGDGDRRKIQTIVTDVLIPKNEVLRVSNKGSFSYMTATTAHSMNITDSLSGRVVDKITINRDGITKVVKCEIEKIIARRIDHAIDTDYILDELKKVLDTPVLSKYNDNERVIQTARYVLKTL